jgi:hypothetical protein
LPFTLTSGLGIVSVIGRILLPKPAAKTIAVSGKKELFIIIPSLPEFDLSNSRVISSDRPRICFANSGDDVIC